MERRTDGQVRPEVQPTGSHKTKKRLKDGPTKHSTGPHRTDPNRTVRVRFMVRIRVRVNRTAPNVGYFVGHLKDN